MPFFIINGYASCPNFSHAIIVAEYLSNRLPNFEYKKIEVAATEWGEHMMEINKQTKWFLVKSPLIWKEIHHWGGKKYLIGGLGEFWEYIYSYYGLESIIPKLDLQKLAADNLKFYEEKVRETSKRIDYVQIFGILGASNAITTLLLRDLFEVRNFRKEHGIIVRLYDENCIDERRYRVMEDTANYYNSQNIFGKEPTVFIVNTLKEMLDHCDLLIIVEDFRSNFPGQREITLKKCYARMNYLSEAIISSRHRRLKIIIASRGPACFMATCLVEFCTTVRPADIVVIAADKGLSYINVISEKCNVPVSNICAPPVWGFIGMYSFVDQAQTVFKADVYRPNFRSLTSPRGSTLPLGTIKSELRLMSYLIADYDEIVRLVEHRKRKIEKTLERPSILGKIRSIVSLLTLWYADQPTDDILSLGVCSDGSFDIPAGIVFSQPVMLDTKRRWYPFSEFPLMNDSTKSEIAKCVKSTSEVLKQFNLLRHMCKGDGDICSNKDCPVHIDSLF